MSETIRKCSSLTSDALEGSIAIRHVHFSAFPGHPVFFRLVNCMSGFMKTGSIFKPNINPLTHMHFDSTTPFGKVTRSEING